VILVALGGLWPARTPGPGGLAGCCWFLEEELGRAAGQFEDAALDGCVDGEFLGFAAR
jgi:hypothetical protein